MKLQAYIIICIIIIKSTFSFAGELSEKKKIFYLNSYDVTFHTFQCFEQSINEIFSNTNYIIDTDFLDSKRFTNKEVYANLKERIKIKLNKREKYDIILASDDNALNFILDNYDELFTKTPVVFWGFDDHNLINKLESIPYVTGVMETAYLKENIKLIQKVQPTISEIIAITDDTRTGVIDNKAFESEKLANSKTRLSVIHTNEFTIKELQDTISKMEADKALLRLSAYKLKDANLNLYEQIDLLFKDSPVPVYCAGIIEINEGFTGGCLSDYSEQTKLACKMGIQILNGVSPKELPIITNLPGVYKFNYKDLQKYDIQQRLLPKGTEIIGAPSRKLNIRKDIFYVIILSLIVAISLLLINVALVINKRKLTNKLRVSQKNYETLFRESPSINLLIDPDNGKIVDGNNAALRYYGYSIDELKELSITDINTLPIADVYEKIEQVKRGNIKNLIFSHKKKNGQIFDVEVFTGKLNLNDRTYIHSIIVDITDRLNAEKLIIEAKQKAEESDNLKTSFLANMSHEIRTPMNSILGFSDLLINDDIPEPKQKEFLQMIYSNGNHLLNLINDIIDISKIEANQLKVLKKETQLNKIMDELYLEFNNRHTDKNLQLELIKGSHDDNYQIVTDGLRLKQILINLLSNSFKFTDSGLISFGYKIRKDGNLQFFVKDTGIGIPEDKHEFVFSVFQRMEDSYNRNYSGAGLGLSITKSLVEKLGGHIWLMSKMGEGSRFYFTIPSGNEKLKM